MIDVNICCFDPKLSKFVLQIGGGEVGPIMISARGRGHRSPNDGMRWQTGEGGWKWPNRADVICDGSHKRTISNFSSTSDLYYYKLISLFYHQLIYSSANGQAWDTNGVSIKSTECGAKASWVRTKILKWHELLGGRGATPKNPINLEKWVPYLVFFISTLGFLGV